MYLHHSQGSRNYFNSQPHKEADADWINTGSILVISTHSLTRRLTSHQRVISALFYISTHSLTRRLTKLDGAYQIIQEISTHSLTRRLTIKCLYSLVGFTYFNSQPHKEADSLGLIAQLYI